MQSMPSKELPASDADDSGPVVFLSGPTAAGKTDIAVHLVDRFAAQIISVDSAQVFRGLDIGTGKPDRALLARAPHRLIDIRDPDECYSAAEFHADARRAIRAIRAEGRLPLLVGGTGLYFRALERGLSPLPKADRRLREAFEIEAASIGWPAMHARLAQVDAQAAKRIHPNDPQRIGRALEIHGASGRSMSQWLESGRRHSLAAPICRIVLEPLEHDGDRSLLHRRIHDRFTGMLKKGLVDEVEALDRNWQLDAHSPSMRAVGYRQVRSFLRKEYGFDEMVERALAATRQLAKRQITWWRSERQSFRVDCHAPDRAERVAGRIDQFLAECASASGGDCQATSALGLVN
ncbi:tRNA (adenosine(37)-N6)-dimethylallyltransferase MiaA [Thioalkalivibrio sp. HK1]|uniref:tRNA (adenosine(37)-N6)-dimethylallyltransferase MiaA n=1 Tax=Thioalkalivibrio sp. HK1 TaxID=1469245 RepID=UPI00047197CB|nr:tRNA (adenosine(37)-N6)-dimethylallyltransferase MiaA [Thioalkalivibrio sp. HK1]